MMFLQGSYYCGGGRISRTTTEKHVKNETIEVSKHKEVDVKNEVFREVEKESCESGSSACKKAQLTDEKFVKNILPPHQETLTSQVSSINECCEVDALSVISGVPEIDEVVNDRDPLKKPGPIPDFFPKWGKVGLWGGSQIIPKRVFSDIDHWKSWMVRAWKIEVAALEDELLRQLPSQASSYECNTYDESSRSFFLAAQGIAKERIYKLDEDPKESDTVLKFRHPQNPRDSKNRTSAPNCVKIYYDHTFLEGIPIWSNNSGDIEYWIPGSADLEESLFGEVLKYVEIPQDASMKIILNSIQTIEASPVSEALISLEDRELVNSGQKDMSGYDDWPVLPSTLTEPLLSLIDKQQLDPSQKEVVCGIGCLLSRIGSLLYVCGPPGTGKTHMIREFCTAFHQLKRNEGGPSVWPNAIAFQIGVFSSTNASVADITSALEEIVPTLRFTSNQWAHDTNKCDLNAVIDCLADEHEIRPFVTLKLLRTTIEKLEYEVHNKKGKEGKKRKKELKKARLQEADLFLNLTDLLVSLSTVVTGTTVSSHRVKRNLLVAIEDEAFNATSQTSTVASGRASINVKLGDFKQSPPRSITPLFRESSGAQIFGGGSIVEVAGTKRQVSPADYTLTTQYRSNEKLSRTSSYVHDDQLECYDASAGRKKECFKHATLLIHTSSSEGCHRQIPEESRIVTRLTQEIFKRFLKEPASKEVCAKLRKLVGIITPYLGQRRMIINDLKKEEIPTEVTTYERALGREWEITILSLGSLTKMTDFVSFPEKSHVALSRAKVLQIIVGNFGIFEKNLWGNLYCHTLSECPVLNADLISLDEVVDIALQEGGSGLGYLHERIESMMKTPEVKEVALIKEVVEYFSSLTAPELWRIGDKDECSAGLNAALDPADEIADVYYVEEDEDEEIADALDCTEERDHEIETSVKVANNEETRKPVEAKATRPKTSQPRGENGGASTPKGKGEHQGETPPSSLPNSNTPEPAKQSSESQEMWDLSKSSSKTPLVSEINALTSTSAPELKVNDEGEFDDEDIFSEDILVAAISPANEVFSPAMKSENQWKNLLGFHRKRGLRVGNFNTGSLRSVATSHEHFYRKFIKSHDIISLPEHRLTVDVDHEALLPAGYSFFLNVNTSRPGFSGCGFAIRSDLAATCTSRTPSWDTDGRFMYLISPFAIFVSAYFPTSVGPGDQSRVEFDKNAISHLQMLQKTGKPVIIIGDFNGDIKKFEKAQIEGGALKDRPPLGLRPIDNDIFPKLEENLFTDIESLYKPAKQEGGARYENTWFKDAYAKRLNNGLRIDYSFTNDPSIKVHSYATKPIDGRADHHPISFEISLPDLTEPPGQRAIVAIDDAKPHPLGWGQVLVDLLKEWDWSWSSSKSAPAEAETYIGRITRKADGKTIEVYIGSESSPERPWSHVINANGQEVQNPSNTTFCRMKGKLIQDNIMCALATALDLLTKSPAKSQTLLVHCKAGRDRAPTIALGLIAGSLKDPHTEKKLRAKLREIRPQINLTFTSVGAALVSELNGKKFATSPPNQPQPTTPTNNPRSPVTANISDLEPPRHSGKEDNCSKSKFKDIDGLKGWSKPKKTTRSGPYSGTPARPSSTGGLATPTGPPPENVNRGIFSVLEVDSEDDTDFEESSEQGNKPSGFEEPGNPSSCNKPASIPITDRCILSNSKEIDPAVPDLTAAEVTDLVNRDSRFLLSVGKYIEGAEPPVWNKGRTSVERKKLLLTDYGRAFSQGRIDQNKNIIGGFSVLSSLYLRQLVGKFKAAIEPHKDLLLGFLEGFYMTARTCNSTSAEEAEFLAFTNDKVLRFFQHLSTITDAGNFVYNVLYHSIDCALFDKSRSGNSTGNIFESILAILEILSTHQSNSNPQIANGETITVKEISSDNPVAGLEDHQIPARCRLLKDKFLYKVSATQNWLDKDRSFEIVVMLPFKIDYIPTLYDALLQSLGACTGIRYDKACQRRSTDECREIGIGILESISNSNPSIGDVKFDVTGLYAKIYADRCFTAITEEAMNTLKQFHHHKDNLSACVAEELKGQLRNLPCRVDGMLQSYDELKKTLLLRERDSLHLQLLDQEMNLKIEMISDHMQRHYDHGNLEAVPPLKDTDLDPEFLDLKKRLLASEICFPMKDSCSINPNAGSSPDPSCGGDAENFFPGDSHQDYLPAGISQPQERSQNSGSSPPQPRGENGGPVGLETHFNEIGEIHASSQSEAESEDTNDSGPEPLNYLDEADEAIKADPKNESLGTPIPENILQLKNSLRAVKAIDEAFMRTKNGKGDLFASLWMDDVACSGKTVKEVLAKCSGIVGGISKLRMGVSSRKFHLAKPSCTHTGTDYLRGDYFAGSEEFLLEIANCGIPANSSEMSTYLGKIQASSQTFNREFGALAGPLRKYCGASLSTYKSIYNDVSALRSLSDIRIFAACAVTFKPLPYEEIIAETRRMYCFVDASLASYGHTIITVPAAPEEPAKKEGKKESWHEIPLEDVWVHDCVSKHFGAGFTLMDGQSCENHALDCYLKVDSTLPCLPRTIVLDNTNSIGALPPVTLAGSLRSGRKRSILNKANSNFAYLSQAPNLTVLACQSENNLADWHRCVENQFGVADSGLKELKDLLRKGEKITKKVLQAPRSDFEKALLEKPKEFLDRVFARKRISVELPPLKLPIELLRDPQVRKEITITDVEKEFGLPKTQRDAAHFFDVLEHNLVAKKQGREELCCKPVTEEAIKEGKKQEEKELRTILNEVGEIQGAMRKEEFNEKTPTSCSCCPKEIKHYVFEASKLQKSSETECLEIGESDATIEELQQYVGDIAEAWLSIKNRVGERTAQKKTYWLNKTQLKLLHERSECIMKSKFLSYLSWSKFSFSQKEVDEVYNECPFCWNWNDRRETSRCSFDIPIDDSCFIDGIVLSDSVDFVPALQHEKDYSGPRAYGPPRPPLFEEAPNSWIYDTPETAFYVEERARGSFWARACGTPGGYFDAVERRRESPLEQVHRCITAWEGANEGMFLKLIQWTDQAESGYLEPFKREGRTVDTTALDAPNQQAHLCIRQHWFKKIYYGLNTKYGVSSELRTWKLAKASNLVSSLRKAHVYPEIALPQDEDLWKLKVKSGVLPDEVYEAATSNAISRELKRRVQITANVMSNFFDSVDSAVICRRNRKKGEYDYARLLAIPDGLARIETGASHGFQKRVLEDLVWRKDLRPPSRWALLVNPANIEPIEVFHGGNPFYQLCLSSSVRLDAYRITQPHLMTSTSLNDVGKTVSNIINLGLKPGSGRKDLHFEGTCYGEAEQEGSNSNVSILFKKVNQKDSPDTLLKLRLNSLTCNHYVMYRGANMYCGRKLAEEHIEVANSTEGRKLKVELCLWCGSNSLADFLRGQNDEELAKDIRKDTILSDRRIWVRVSDEDDKEGSDMLGKALKESMSSPVKRYLLVNPETGEHLSRDVGAIESKITGVPRKADTDLNLAQDNIIPETRVIRGSDSIFSGSANSGKLPRAFPPAEVGAPPIDQEAFEALNQGDDSDFEFEDSDEEEEEEETLESAKRRRIGGNDIAEVNPKVMKESKIRIALMLEKISLMLAEVEVLGTLKDMALTKAVMFAERDPNLKKESILLDFRDSKGKLKYQPYFSYQDLIRSDEYVNPFHFSTGVSRVGMEPAKIGPKESKMFDVADFIRDTEEVDVSNERRRDSHKITNLLMFLTGVPITETVGVGPGYLKFNGAECSFDAFSSAKEGSPPVSVEIPEVIEGALKEASGGKDAENPELPEISEIVPVVTYNKVSWLIPRNRKNWSNFEGTPGQLKNVNVFLDNGAVCGGPNNLINRQGFPKFWDAEFSDPPQGADRDEELEKNPCAVRNTEEEWGPFDPNSPIELSHIADDPLPNDQRQSSVTSMGTEEGAEILREMGYEEFFMDPVPGYEHVNSGLGGDSVNKGKLRYFIIPFVMECLQRLILGPPVIIVIMSNWVPKNSQFVLGAGDFHRFGVIPQINPLKKFPSSHFVFRNLANPRFLWKFKIPNVINVHRFAEDNTEIAAIGEGSVPPFHSASSNFLETPKTEAAGNTESMDKAALGPDPEQNALPKPPEDRGEDLPSPPPPSNCCTEEDEEIFEVKKSEEREGLPDPAKEAQDPSAMRGYTYKVQLPFPTGTLVMISPENPTYTIVNSRSLLGKALFCCTDSSAKAYEVRVKRKLHALNEKESWPRAMRFKVCVLAGKASTKAVNSKGFSIKAWTESELKEFCHKDDNAFKRDPKTFFDLIKDKGFRSPELRQLLIEDCSRMHKGNLNRQFLEKKVDETIEFIAKNFSTRIEELENGDEIFPTAEEGPVGKTSKKKKKGKKKGNSNNIPQASDAEECADSEGGIYEITASSKRKGPTLKRDKKAKKKKPLKALPTKEECDRIDDEWYAMRRVCGRDSIEWLQTVALRLFNGCCIESLYEEILEEYGGSPNPNTTLETLAEEKAELVDRFIYALALQHYESFHGEGQDIHLSSVTMDHTYINPKKLPTKTQFKMQATDCQNLENYIIDKLLRREVHQGILKEVKVEVDSKGNGVLNLPLWCSPVGLAGRSKDIGRLYVAYLEPNLAAVNPSPYPIHKSLTHSHLVRAGTRWYMSLDVSKAFNSIKCAESLSKYLAVRSTTSSVYRPLRMTLGFAPIPSVYQHALGGEICGMRYDPQDGEDLLQDLVSAKQLDGAEGLPETHNIIPFSETIRNRLIERVKKGGDPCFE